MQVSSSNEEAGPEPALQKDDTKSTATNEAYSIVENILELNGNESNDKETAREQ